MPAADIHRVLSHSLEAEQGVLGSMLISPEDTVPAMIELVADGDFYNPNHGTLFKLLVEAWRDNIPHDIITLTDVLRGKSKLEEMGGPAYITHLFTFTPTAANAVYYGKIVAEKAWRRRIAVATQKLNEAAYAPGTSNEELSEQLQHLLCGMAQQASTGRPVATMADCIPDAIERMEERFNGKGRLRGIASGLGLLDGLTNGWQGGQMIVISAPEKQGKSSLARQFVIEAAVNREIPCAIFSHEMSRQEITDAMIATRAKIDGQRLDNGTLTEEDFPKFKKAAKELKESPIFIFDEADSSVLQFRANARRAVQEFGCRLIVLDYLQLVANSDNSESREQAVSEVGRNVKLAAKELNVPIIALSQLNKDGVTQYAKAIQQHLDKHIVIEQENPDGEGDRKAWIKLKLSRGGPTGSIPTMWKPAITYFEPMAKERPPEPQKPVKNSRYNRNQ